ncbi:replication factor c protein, putative [Plasmodium berghei]|uniref:P-loop containing nucleoside triphosphate hydrolase, putative n=2 Tax=Plasmodium berghei TaxID=5821 RepID=A0A509AEX5_PLABA|nr:P-loop containing nucleoside triphosphate hydrolase, putative [Plasmodium berghei ANKA]CXH85745.1 replication factor c protein, putative [Plasmodium berghei]SCL89896.1 replication factor c protein, putative [Plasmodium berghei]SCM15175.1 replication factor c protein, putative [Plasmodium berghei]SCM16970.1 replication factor c protein, putative [Plasmodium berghei]SCN21786.1 replication factor c protein, putative [Plasmodium berghei]|eukprot:XP_034419751.1 P-loop containing nucleoside triphosphate hydrolase, putative [Plasmodium berghei ANKA]
MELNLDDFNDFDRLDNILINEIEKEKKQNVGDKRKFDIYDDYQELLNTKIQKKNNKKKETVNNNYDNVSNIYEQGQENIQTNDNYHILFNREFHNHYIFNDYKYLKEYVYKNNLMSDDIYFKKDEVIMKNKIDSQKMFQTNEDLTDFIKIYDVNNNYPPIYLNLFKKSDTDTTSQSPYNYPLKTHGEEDIPSNLQKQNISIFTKSKKENFRDMLERVLNEIKQENIDKERKNKGEYTSTNNLMSKENDESNIFSQKMPTENVNFVEKYRGKYFSELLTDEAINREAILWIKQWNDLIKKEKEVIYKNNEEEKKEYFKKFNEFPKILLLGGSAGKGKTTLAYVIANHFKFNVIEINGSDDRNKETLIPFIESIVCNNSIGSKPNICIIDEIDGLSSTYQNIEAIMNFLNKKDKKNMSIIKRPIICICNDIYHKSLKELRKICKVVLVENINIQMLKGRINYICDKENIKISNEAINKLIDIYKSDIRAILNTIYFLSIGLRSLNLNGNTNNGEGTNSTSYTNFNNKTIITLDTLNLYLFHKDANNNYIELLNIIYVKNKNKKLIKKLLLECYNFFHICLGTEYNYLQSYYYIYDNLLNIPFNDFDFSKLGYGLDFLAFCDHLEYKQKQILNFSLQKMLYLSVYLFIIIIHLNTNSHIQYILMNNSTSNHFRKKQIDLKNMKNNFINDKFAVITYKYIYSKYFYSEILNYIFAFFYTNEFFFKNVHLWGKQNYYKDIDFPKYILVPYEYKNVSKFKLFSLKLLLLMTIFNISFTSISSSLPPTQSESTTTTKSITNQNLNKHNSFLNNNNMTKVYIFDPFVDDLLIYAQKKNNIFSSYPYNQNKQINYMTNTSFNFKTFPNILNNDICEALNDLKNWINNISAKYNKKNKEKHLNQMQIVKSSYNHKNTKKSIFDVTYASNFEQSLTDIILIAYQNGYQHSYKHYFLNQQNESDYIENKQKNQSSNILLDHIIPQTKILSNKDNSIFTISDLIAQEKSYMKKYISNNKNIYFSGKYIKTSGYYKNVEERCNAVLQPLNFYVVENK